MSHILSSLTSLIIQIVSTLGYAGVGFLMALQTVAIPIPSEVILPFAGYLDSLGRFNIFFIGIAGALGSSVGASVAYYIGLKGGRPLVEKYGKYILISHNDLNFTEKFFGKFGSIAVFIGQLLPIVRSFIGFAAGLAKENYSKFLISIFIGSFLWSLILAYIGKKLGDNWGALRNRFHNIDLFIILAVILVLIWWVWRHFRQSKSE